jgi:hypothetical protein
MAKHRYGKKGSKKGKSRKRAAAARKGWRNRKAQRATHRSSRSSRRSGHRVSAKRRAAGKRLWALMKKRHGGHAGAVAYLKRMRNRAR